MVDDLRDEIEREFVVERTGWAAERAARVTENLQRDIAPVERLQSLVIWWSDHNAFTTFGRTVYVSRRLFERLPDDDSAAFIIAHELAHHRLGHIPSLGASRLLPARLVLAVLSQTLCRPRRETDADQLAIEMCLGAGYDVERCLVALHVLTMVALDQGDVDGAFGGDERRSHPALSKRIADVREHASGVRAGVRLDVRRAISREQRRRRQQILRALCAGASVAALAILLRRLR
jgi:predicted Zn-dependent protease